MFSDRPISSLTEQSGVISNGLAGTFTEIEGHK